MRHGRLKLLVLSFVLALPSRAWTQLSRTVRVVPAAPAPVAPLPGAVGPALTLSAQTLNAPSAPSLTPRLSAAPSVVAVAVSAASARARATTPAAATPAVTAHAPTATAEALLRNAPGTEPGARPRETDAERLGAMARSAAPGSLWTGEARRQTHGAAIDAQGRPASAAFRARLGAANAAAEERGPAGTVVIPAPSAVSRARDWLHYARITGSSLYWYTFPRLVERWSELSESLDEAAGRPRAVRRIMAFFIAHRVLGSTGSYAPMGFRVAANQTVVDDAWRIYDAYFPEDPEGRAAFGRLVERALRFNPNRRSTQFRKVVFHALREASTLRPEAVPAYFDSLATEDKAASLAAYQAAEQGRVLERFTALSERVILELNAGLPPGRRVVGAVLLGSFANGAAGPGSDLDVQTLSEDGKTAYNAEFLKRLKAVWKAEGVPSHPVSGFEYGLPLSRALLTRVHREPYLVISPYPEVRRSMSTAPQDLQSHGTHRGLRGKAFVLFYSGVLFGVLAAYEAWRRLRRARA